MCWAAPLHYFETTGTKVTTEKISRWSLWSLLSLHSLLSLLSLLSLTSLPPPLLKVGIKNFSKKVCSKFGIVELCRYICSVLVA